MFDRKDLADIAVIGGSGFYELLSDVEHHAVQTPYGPPSGQVAVGTYEGVRVAFLARHGPGHRYPPHRINYRANVWALAALGARRILGPNASGSLQPHVKPGDFVVVDQFVDRTTNRESTFYDGPPVVHIGGAEPYCPELRTLAVAAGRELGITVHDTGTVVVIQGPRFSTRAESRWFSSEGWEVVNMTQFPEQVLARELEVCYVGISLITDYDVGLADRDDIEAVSVAGVIEVFHRNNARVRDLLLRMIPRIPRERACICATALTGAVIDSSKLVTVGSLGLDTLETPFERVERVLGGSAPYFALAAKLYTDVGIVAVIGDDYPQQHIDLLDKKGVNLDGLQRTAGESFFWEAKYHYDMNTRDTIETRLGVFADFKPVLPQSYRNAPFVFLANILPTLQMSVQEQVESPQLVVLDSMNLWIETQKDNLTEAMRRSNLITINDQEAREYAGTPNLLTAARAIMKLGPSGVIVKKGEHGVILVSEHGVFGAPALLLEEVKDPTGAGDSFAGAFMGYLAAAGDLSFGSIKRALIHGTAVASFTVESLGIDRLATVTRDDVEARYRELLEFTSFETIAV